jgi:hypothetical protein
MPQIVVTSIPIGRDQDGAVMLRERIAVADLESAHFREQLIERLGWAVRDADEAEQSQPASGAVPPPDHRVAEESHAYAR